jgi:hypothetical protein
MKMMGGGTEDGLVVTFWPYLQSMVQQEQLSKLTERLERDEKRQNDEQPSSQKKKKK